MTTDQMFEAVGYVLAFAAICSRSKWRLLAEDRKVELLIAEERVETLTLDLADARADADTARLERNRPAVGVFDNSIYINAPAPAPVSKAFERAVDQALQQPEPTPDLRRIQ